MPLASGVLATESGPVNCRRSCESPDYEEAERQLPCVWNVTPGCRRWSAARTMRRVVAPTHRPEAGGGAQCGIGWHCVPQGDGPVLDHRAQLGDAQLRGDRGIRKAISVGEERSPRDDQLRRGEDLVLVRVAQPHRALDIGCKRPHTVPDGGRGSAPPGTGSLPCVFRRGPGSRAARRTLLWNVTLRVNPAVLRLGRRGRDASMPGRDAIGSRPGRTSAGTAQVTARADRQWSPVCCRVRRV